MVLQQCPVDFGRYFLPLLSLRKSLSRHIMKNLPIMQRKNVALSSVDSHDMRKPSKNVFKFPLTEAVSFMNTFCKQGLMLQQNSNLQLRFFSFNSRDNFRRKKYNVPRYHLRENPLYIKGKYRSLKKYTPRTQNVRGNVLRKGRFGPGGRNKPRYHPKPYRNRPQLMGRQQTNKEKLDFVKKQKKYKEKVSRKQWEMSLYPRHTKEKKKVRSRQLSRTYNLKVLKPRTKKQTVLICTGVDHNKERLAKSLETRYLNKGILTKRFLSGALRLAWYERVKNELAEKNHEKLWRKRTDRALELLEKEASQQRPVKLATARQYIKKYGEDEDTIESTHLTKEQIKQKYYELKEKQLAIKLKERAERQYNKLIKEEKLKGDGYTSPDELSQWVEEQSKKDLLKAKKHATQEFDKGSLNFSPKLASDKLLLLWYHQQRRKSKAKNQI